MSEDLEPRPPEGDQPSEPAGAGDANLDEPATEPAVTENIEVAEPPVCPNCGVPKGDSGVHCPQCGATYAPAQPATRARLSLATGCLSVFGGLVAGVVASALVIGAVRALAFANSMSNNVFSGLVIVVDLLALALAVRVIWGARRGLTPLSLFVICIALTLTGMLSTCSFIVFNLGGSKFN